VNSELVKIWKEAACSLFSGLVNGVCLHEENHETFCGLRFEPGTFLVRSMRAGRDVYFIMHFARITSRFYTLPYAYIYFVTCYWRCKRAVVQTSHNALRTGPSAGQPSLCQTPLQALQLLRPTVHNRTLHSAHTVLLVCSIWFSQ
jgi:hypothetical protein